MDVYYTEWNVIIKISEFTAFRIGCKEGNYSPNDDVYSVDGIDRQGKVWHIFENIKLEDAENIIGEIYDRLTGNLPGIVAQRE